MRKGHTFEHEIDKVLNAVRAAGYHTHQNHALRTIDGIFLDGEPFDYEVFMPDKIDVFDAKEVKGDKWHMKDKDIKQCHNLYQCAKNKECNAYFLIWWNRGEVSVVDAEKVMKVLASGKRTVGKEFGVKWDLIERLKKSVKK